MAEKTVRILVVEDEEAHAELIRRAFQRGKEPVELAVARTLAEARACLAESTPDLLITDRRLSDGDGIELVPPHDEAEFPVVVMTAFGDEQTAVDAMKAGALDYVVKSEAALSDMPHVADRALREWRFITERKHAEEELHDREEKLRTVVEHSHEVYFIHDTNHQLTYVSPHCVEVFGYTPEQMAVKWTTFVTENPTNEKGFGLTERAVSTGERQEPYLLEVRRRDGELRWVEVDESPVKDASGRVVAISGALRDVTERRQLQEQLQQSQKMEAAGQLAGGIAHDFNNILQAILGYANALRLDSEPGTQQYEDLETIEQAAERAAELTGQLLGFARKGKYQVVPVDVHATIREAVALLGRSIDKRIRLSMDFGTTDAIVSGDPGQLEQVFVNLAVNARDAMPDGGELVISTDIVDLDEDDCRAFAHARPGRFLKIGISDTGCGMSQETRARIFEPFFTTKGPAGGSGMGLAMVYGIVTNHHGIVEVYSEEGRGTTFEVHLPLAEGTVGEAPGVVQDDQLVRGAGTVLIVDDDEPARNAAVRMLGSLGYDVHAVSSGREAVDYCSVHRQGADLVMIDLIMPETDGRATFQALKKLNPNVKAILCTGYARDDRVQSALDEGMAGFAQKPYRLRELSNVIGCAMSELNAPGGAHGEQASGPA